MRISNLDELPAHYRKQVEAKLLLASSSPAPTAVQQIATFGKGDRKTSRAKPAAKQAPTIARNGHRRKRVSDHEGDEQRQLIDQFREEFPLHAHHLIHIPNGGSRRNRFEGWRLKAQGVRRGVSDLLMTVARGGFYGLWIEFKAAPPNDAKVTQEQLDWLEEMRRGVKEALEVIRNYMSMSPTLARVAPAPHVIGALST